MELGVDEALEPELGLVGVELALELWSLPLSGLAGLVGVELEPLSLSGLVGVELESLPESGLVGVELESLPLSGLVGVELEPEPESGVVGVELEPLPLSGLVGVELEPESELESPEPGVLELPLFELPLEV